MQQRPQSDDRYQGQENPQSEVNISQGVSGGRLRHGHTALAEHPCENAFLVEHEVRNWTMKQGQGKAKRQPQDVREHRGDAMADCLSAQYGESPKQTGCVLRNTGVHFSAEVARLRLTPAAKRLYSLTFSPVECGLLWAGWWA